ncbi:BglG family transcription antiterminator [Gilliamella sp. B2776]|uniref:BglG family transcription antiterminator n=1 Tax=unclassified Gilliamella TaxID=2685620 RepID=UPI00226A29FB|nr:MULTISPECIES: BglG family transcription antiterminator [unclassified Gilliamella]MCX8650523.1 BglG family transcription antiterminator [Gilliamella sp. B2779]MCX8653946.1 BglG family transcription antiterminator [Gilliamella sp. B2737]MCX8665609.1 BglG family transcription antiterminator [Gilliamella sp. B2887]MCX8692371.1 BglG family transcription antiterminator [Gilliamella sp. B2776]MCX8699066.1 BglG family transcription antiterminator [Gilliamella sp. B3000]
MVMIIRQRTKGNCDMVVDKRIHTVLNALIQNPSISGVELQAEFGLTRKQLSYTFKKINDFLESSNLELIKRFKTGKFSVPKHVIETFRDEPVSKTIGRYIYSEDERVHLLLFFLLTRTERLSLIHLSSALTVSQNTVINDIKKVQIMMVQYHLQISYDRENGYRIVGNEIDKRYLLLELIHRIISMPIADKIFKQNDIITQGGLEQVGQVFSEIEKKLKIIFTDEQLQELTYFICFMLRRIESNKKIEYLPKNYAEVANSRDFQLMKKLIEKFGITDLNEQIFLTILVQSSNIQTLSDKYFHLDTVLLESAVEVINNFEQISCITFKDKSELIERIYQHWKPAYYRIRYHITNINSVYDIVLQEFGHLHEMVRKAIAPFEKILHGNMPDEEVAFITVLFGGWLTREGLINQIKTKKIAIVVCENSATVSTYLYLTLQVLLPELHFSDAMSKREFEKYNHYYDIVFSTSYLSTDKLLFIVNPSVNNFHKNAFRNQVIGTLQGIDPSIIQVEELMLIIEKFSNIKERKALQKELTAYLYNDEVNDNPLRITQQEIPSLADLMQQEHINIAQLVDLSWQDALELAAKPLLSNQSIERCYLERMVNKIQFEQPYIMLVDGLIIAHAGIDDGVNKVAMSLLKFPQKIDICGYIQADLIVVLATNNPQKHLKALAQLNELLELHDGAANIRKANDSHEIRKLFAHYQ